MARHDLCQWKPSTPILSDRRSICAWRTWAAVDQQPAQALDHLFAQGISHLQRQVCRGADQSIYRIATGRDAGGKVATLQTLPGDAGKVGGFSLHAGVAAEAHESHKLEKLCRYITRPAISEKRLSISPQGRVRYQLKTPWRNGTTHVEWDAVDFIAKLAALVPPPRAHLTRFHGVFAPNAALRAQLTPSGRGKRSGADATPVDVTVNDEPRSPEQKRRAMSWAQRLKRVFGIDITTCVHCGGAVRIVASIEEPTPSAPSWSTSRSTACWSKRTIGPPHAHRRLRLRELSLVRRPRARTGRHHDAGHAPQGCARPADGNLRNSHALRRYSVPRSRHPTREPPIRAQSGRLRDRHLPGRLPEKGV